MAGCFFAVFLLLPLRTCDYVDRHDGFEIAVKRESFLGALAGGHGRAEEAVLRLAGEEFRRLTGRSPHYIRDPSAKWLVCVSSATWPHNTVILIDESARKYARAEIPEGGFGAFIGYEDNLHTAKYDRASETLTLIDARLNRSSVLNNFKWRPF